MTESRSKNVSSRLDEVCLLRLILIFLLVIYHTFAPYCGSWREINDTDMIPISYFWIGKASYSFMLECFTFVSGWVFGYQVLNKGRQKFQPKHLVRSKLKRLIVPSVIFSIIYILIFNPDLYKSPLSFTYSILDGAGHLWYLPMLFWCFISIWLIEKKISNRRIAVLGLVILAALSFFPLPFRMGATMQYMIFFYIGYLIGLNLIDIKKYAGPGNIILSLSIFLFAFIISTAFLVPAIITAKEHILATGVEGLFYKSLYLSLLNLIKLIYSALGVTTVTLLSIYLIRSKKLKLSSFWINLSTYTFGIYVFQQFILMWIYYHTPLSKSISIDYLPWIAFAITITASLILSIIMRKNKVGKFLLG